MDPVIHTKVGWHDLRWDPEDLPEEGESILVTQETVDGVRRVASNVYLKNLDDDSYCWCTRIWDPYTHQTEETMLWETVVAWAYYPPPYIV